MPKPHICTLTDDELYNAYVAEGRTLEEMCPILGVKSPITARKILNSRGISTNANLRLKEKTMHGMTDAEFREYLRREYSKGKSMDAIGRDLCVTASCLRKYFIKYEIPIRSTTDYFQKSPQSNPNWRGGKRIKKNGYVEIYCPDHPNANSRKCVYEHQLVMESHIGRYIHAGEVIHHIDGNKQNNDISNLLLLTNSEHVKLHAIMRRGYNRMKRG